MVWRRGFGAPFAELKGVLICSDDEGREAVVELCVYAWFGELHWTVEVNAQHRSVSVLGSLSQIVR